MKIQYRDKVLSNPCLLALEIVNSGNDAINDPPIKIRTDENIEIIPGYFEDVPSGYEGLWSFSKTTPNSCNIQLEHLNPKQVVKTRFFLDNLPQNKMVFECPMPNLQIQEAAYNDRFIWLTDIHLESSQVAIFIMSSLLLTVILNAYGVPIADKYIKAHPKQATFIKLVIILVSIILLALIICDYIIVHFIPQVITAIFVVILLSLFIHFSFVSKSL